MVCLFSAAALVDAANASPKIPTANVSDPGPSPAVLASELLELNMSRVEAEAILKRLGFRGGIYNLNHGSADGMYCLPDPDAEAIVLHYGWDDEKKMRHLKHWCISTGGAGFIEPPVFPGMCSFKLEELSMPDQWPLNSTLHAASGCLSPIEDDRSVDVPLLTIR